VIAVATFGVILDRWVVAAGLPEPAPRPTIQG
jgi:hypothetical protein